MPLKPKVDPEFKALLPQLRPEEYQALDLSLQVDGCQDAIIVWRGTGLVVDGHNRLEICERHGIRYRVEEVNFSNREQVIEWMVGRQLGKRNLTDKERLYYIGKQHLLAKRSVGKPVTVTELPEGGTAQAIAEKNGVSASTVYRAAEFAEQVDQLPPEERAQALAEGLKEHSGKHRKPKKRNGQQIGPNWQAFNSAWGKVVRFLDELGGPAHKECPERHGLQRLLGQFHGDLQKWAKKIKKAEDKS